MVTSKTTNTAIRSLPKSIWRMGIACMGITLMTYILAFPVRYDQLLTNPTLTPLVATIQIGIDYLLIASLTVISFVLAFRRQNDFITLLMALTLITAPPNITGMSYLSVTLHPLLNFPVGIITMAITPITFVLLISLPDGHLYSRKLLWVIPILFFYDFWRYLLLMAFPPPNSLTLRPIATIPNFIIIGFGVLVMIHRYRTHATPLQRQQFKWLFLGLTIEISLLAFNQLVRVGILLMGVDTAIMYLITSFTGTIGGILLCVSLVLAISRYGLWDIDLTINRSVVAGFVTISLILLFGVIFWLTQTLLRSILGSQQSEISVAISALVVGGAFNPVRQRTRTFVDRRLYGFRFDLNQLAQHKAKADVLISGALTGKTLGGYELMEVVGRGNMGEVYKGIANNKLVAVKIMQSYSSQDDNTLRQRFEREGKIVLAHPNIVQTLKAGEENGVFYIVMEYVEGVTLKELLIEREHLPLRDIQGYLRDLAGAIDYAHAQGYVHRDIKPSNIMLRRSGTNHPRQIMLMDFGIAKFLGDSTSLTGSAAVGTIDYMAPEQIKDSTTVDYRADIYALGVVLYETLTGVLPFKGNLAQVLFAHVNQPAPDIRQIRPDMSLEVSIALQRALQKDPADRFQSATDFVEALTSG
ncbi:MAG: serine/threonine-protein kinase [bacterium]|nr:serine/threonine-protein kinase [bacterium]